MSQNNKRNQATKSRNQPSTQTQSKPATSSATDTLPSTQPPTSTMQMNASTSPSLSTSDVQSTPNNKDKASALAQSLSTQSTLNEQLDLPAHHRHVTESLPPRILIDSGKL